MSDESYLDYSKNLTTTLSNIGNRKSVSNKMKISNNFFQKSIRPIGKKSTQ